MRLWRARGAFVCWLGVHRYTKAYLTFFGGRKHCELCGFTTEATVTL